jgi:murein DD-endopeptidase MepM/ murein hydrolase activator NlpD
LASRRYSIIVADRSTGVVRRLTISLGPTIAMATAVAALPVLMGLGAKWSGRAQVARLEREKATLLVESASYREATMQLTAQISSLQAAVEDLGARAAVDPLASRAMDRLPAVVKSRAMGGGTPVAALAPMLGTAFASPDDAFGVLHDLLGALHQRLEAMRSGVERREALANATPSIWPVAGWLSSAYGNRRDPFTGGSDFHPGLDISADHGTPVHVTADGTVQTAGFTGNYGNLIVVDHGFGIQTRYGHLARFTAREGDRVRRGQIIGHVGSTGRSTSPHLHYEILTNGKLTNPLRILAR